MKPWAAPTASTAWWTGTYELMDELPEAYAARRIHPEPSANVSLFEFLSGWFSGPNLYIEKRAIRACACATRLTRSVPQSVMNGCCVCAPP